MVIVEDWGINLLLQLRRDEEVWGIALGDVSVAEIHLDHWHQVDEVLLNADASDDVQLEVLRLAVSHVHQYIKHRTISAFGGLMVGEHRNATLTDSDSNRLMDFKAVPAKIQEMDRETVVRVLRQFNVDVVTVVHNTVKEAIDAAIFQVGVDSLTYGVTRGGIFHNELEIEFTVGRPHRFTFWNCAWKPSRGGSDLQVVPSYHPVMNDWTSVGMVNGDTGAYIRGNSIRSIYCPKAARSLRHKEDFGTTWSNVRHPYVAKGRSVGMCIITTKLRSAEGVEAIVQLLRASLGVDQQKYVEISGGFRAPMKCAYNRLVELRRRSPWPGADYDRRGGNIARGSEQHCVWTYRTLQTEGILERAYVPSWFIKEGWLGIYEGAEVRPGLY